MRWNQSRFQFSVDALFLPPPALKMMLSLPPPADFLPTNLSPLKSERVAVKPVWNSNSSPRKCVFSLQPSPERGWIQIAFGTETFSPLSDSSHIREELLQTLLNQRWQVQHRYSAGLKKRGGGRE